MYNIPANTLFIGKKLHYLPSCHSTNEVAQRLINNNYPHGTVVITDDQYAGRGQKGNSWEAEEGQNLTLSIILYPQDISPGQQFELTKITTLAIKDFISSYLNIEMYIKWPNDIYYYQEKIGGILINSSIYTDKLVDCVIGIGLNVNQETFHSPKATSLSRITGKKYDLQVILEGLLHAFERRYNSYSQGGKKALHVEYLQYLYGINLMFPYHDLLTDEIFSGIIRGIDENGRLKIEVGKEMRIYSFKEVGFL